MLIPSNATSVRTPVEVFDSANVEATGLTHLSAITFAYLRPADAAWVNVPVVEGSATFTAGGFRSRDGHVYEFCWPDAAVVANESTLLRYVYDGSTTYDVLDARLASSTPTFVVPRSVVEEYELADDTDLVYRGTQWTISCEDLPSTYAATAVYFGLKDGDVTDDEATLQVKYVVATETTTIVRINGAAPPVGVVGSAVITAAVDNSGDSPTYSYTLVLEGEAAALIPPTELITASDRVGLANTSRRRGYLSEWKLVGDEDIIVKGGYVMVRPDVNRATS